MEIRYSEKLKKLPPYLFIEIDKAKKKLIDKGIDIISLGVGDPDLPTPGHIIESGARALHNPAYHQYPFGPGLKEFRETVSLWYKDRFGVRVSPENEVCALIGSKEGIGHLPLGFIGPGDVVLVPDPGYPVYKSSTIFAGGEIYAMPLLEENGFLPDFGSIPAEILKRAKLMFLNYPNNPTSAVAGKDFFIEAVTFAKEHGIIIAHDAAYSEIYFEEPPVSFLSVDGAMDVGVEFHSLSKTYNMTGWRLGWLCGNSRVIQGISTVKDNFDSGVFSAIQKAGITALSGPQGCVEEMRKVYLGRRNVLVDGLKKIGWNISAPKATFYVWAHCPGGYNSSDTARKLLEEAAIVATPGIGLGANGEGYVRFALTVPEPRMKEAVERIKKVTW